MTSSRAVLASPRGPSCKRHPSVPVWLLPRSKPGWETSVPRASYTGSDHTCRGSHRRAGILGQAKQAPRRHTGSVCGDRSCASRWRDSRGKVGAADIVRRQGRHWLFILPGGLPGTQSSSQTPAVAVTAKLGVLGVRPQARAGSARRAGSPLSSEPGPVAPSHAQLSSSLLLIWLLSAVLLAGLSCTHICAQERRALHRRCCSATQGCVHALQHARPPSFTTSRTLLKLLSIESVMPSNHLILSSSSPPAFNLSQHQSLFQ